MSFKLSRQSPTTLTSELSSIATGTASARSRCLPESQTLYSDWATRITSPTQGDIVKIDQLWIQLA